MRNHEARLRRVEAELQPVGKRRRNRAGAQTFGAAFRALDLAGWTAVRASRWDALPEPIKTLWAEHEKACLKPAAIGSGCVHRDRLERTAQAMLMLDRLASDELAD